MMKHLLRLAGWSLFEKGVEKAVDNKLGHLIGPGTKPKRNPPPRDPYFPDPDDDDDDEDEGDGGWDDEEDEDADDEDDEHEDW